MRVGISEPTVAAYLDHITDSFLFNKIDRWDVKGRRYLSSPSKYYAVDTGLRNARINFRQTEMSHLMENAICNELLRRGYNVDVGVVESTERKGAKSFSIGLACFHISLLTCHVWFGIIFARVEATRTEKEQV